MNDYRIEKKSNGLCRACGKSNKLPIHQECGAKLNAHRPSEAHRLRLARATARKYLKGDLMPEAYQ